MNAGILVKNKIATSQGLKRNSNTAKEIIVMHVLHDLKGIVNQLHRFVAALAPRVLQFVVILRVLEESQIQGQRLADNFTADAVGKLKLDQLLNQPAGLDDPSAEQEKNSSKTR